MADIAAANVTYSFISKDKQFEGRRGFSARGTISFGNASLTYPSGGVPLTKAKIGLPRVLRSCIIMESNAKGYLFEFDRSAETVRIFQQTAKAVTGNVAVVTGTISAPTILLQGNSGNVTADLTIGVNALSNTSFLESSHTSNITGITGIQAPTFTGNVSAFTGDSTSAGVFTELSSGSTAVAACVLEVVCEGY